MTEILAYSPEFVAAVKARYPSNEQICHLADISSVALGSLLRPAALAATMDPERVLAAMGGDEASRQALHQQAADLVEDSCLFLEWQQTAKGWLPELVDTPFLN